MENPSLKEESKGEEMLLYTNIYQSDHQEAIDENDSDSKSCNENEEALQTGRWNNDEHVRFIKGCLLYGNNWKKVKKYVRTRSSAQIRSHAQKYLIKLSKKYPHGELTRSKGGATMSYDLKSIENIINNYRLNNEDMEFAEKMILSKFKNSLNDKSFSNLVFDDFNYKSESSSSKKESTRKDKIFVCVKVPKNKKIEEMQKMWSIQRNAANSNMSHNANINNSYFTISNGNGNRTVNGSGSYESGNMNEYYGQGMTIKDQHLIQQERFINACLDSYDPNDLTKMMIYFNNNSNLNEFLFRNVSEKLFNVNNYTNNGGTGAGAVAGAGTETVTGGGYELNNKHYYSTFENDFKAYGFNTIQNDNNTTTNRPLTSTINATTNANNNVSPNNGFEEKEVIRPLINKEEEGQYFIGLLNDNIKPKGMTVNNSNMSNNNNNNNNGTNNSNINIDNNNNFSIDQGQMNINALPPQNSVPYYYPIRTLQRNGQQSAFSNLNPNKTQSQLQQSYMDDMLKQYFNSHNSQPQFYQQYIP